MKKDINHYMKLNYPIEIRKDPSAGYFVQIPDLTGCFSQGETAEEALEMIEDAKRSWIEVELEEMRPIPEPREIEEFSGRILLRMGRDLHKKLSDQSTREGISLNLYIVSLLSEAVGIKKTEFEVQAILEKVNNLVSQPRPLFGPTQSTSFAILGGLFTGEASTVIENPSGPSTGRRLVTLWPDRPKGNVQSIANFFPEEIEEDTEVQH